MFDGNLLLLTVLAFAVFLMMPGIVSSIYDYKTRLYLKKHHYEVWKELISVFGIPGVYWVSKWRKFIYNDDYLGDPELVPIKEKARMAITCQWIGVIFLILYFVVFTILF